MKTSVLAVVLSFFAVSGWALAAQNTEQKQDPSMEHMMKEGKDGEHMGGMMRMMSMMDQCSRMMESAHASEEPKESPKK
jgi:hypothetical protein